MTLTEPHIQGRNAPDLYGTAWLNGEPYAMRRGDGDIVLLDFWSSTCVHCLADLGQVNAWKENYAEAGLVVIGVHSPEYEFAYDTDHVQHIVEEYDVSYRVVQDNKGSIRASYGVHTLPSKALVDKNGLIRYVLHGRRDAIEFERAMQFLLRESGYYGELPSFFGSREEIERRPDRADVEIRCGYLRGSLGNTEGYAPESRQQYADPGTMIPGRVYIGGEWLSRRESLTNNHADGGASSFRVVMGGGDLFLVARAAGIGPVDVAVELDGKIPAALHLGKDVGRDAGGRPIVRVSEPRAYHVLGGLLEEMHDVVLRPGSGELEVYQVSLPGAGDMRAIFPN